MARGAVLPGTVWVAVSLVSALAVVIAAGAGVAGAAGPVEVAASVDRELSAVGDRITLTVTVTRGAGVLIEGPRGPALGRDIEVVEVLLPEHQTIADGRIQSVFRFVLAAFVTGDQQIEAVGVDYTNPDGSEATARSNPVAFSIRSVIPPGQQPSDIRDLKAQLSLGAGVPSSVYRPLLAGVMVTDLLLLAVVLWRRPAPRRTTVVAPVPAASSWAAQLDAVERDGLLERGEFKPYYRRIALIIRGFLGERYGVPARALTRSELERLMRAEAFDPWQARLVNNLLDEADRVVYAEYRPVRERAEGALGLAYQVVELGERAREPEPALVGA
jgi:hypothetical protein